MLRTRRGVTRIGVLIAILVLGLGAMLLVMLISQSRTEARLRTCKHNLMQLTLAVHSYHESHKSIPPMYANPEKATIASWIGFITAYMEQDGPHRLAPVTMSKEGAEQAYLMDTPENLKNFRDYQYAGMVCPTRRGPMIATYGEIRITPSDYCAVNSTHSCWFGTPERKQANGCIIDPASPVLWENDRVVPLKSQTTFDSITDGLAYTAMIGEKHFYHRWKFGNIDVTPNGQSAADGPSLMGGAIDNLALYHSRRMGGMLEQGDCAANDPVIPLYTPNTGDGTEARHLQAFGSWHVGICQFGMADGHVEEISLKCDVKVLAELGGRNDGETDALPK